jgi:hypothetical protein
MVSVLANAATHHLDRVYCCSDVGGRVRQGGEIFNPFPTRMFHGFVCQRERKFYYKNFCR